MIIRRAAKRIPAGPATEASLSYGHPGLTADAFPFALGIERAQAEETPVQPHRQASQPLTTAPITSRTERDSCRQPVVRRGYRKRDLRPFRCGGQVPRVPVAERLTRRDRCTRRSLPPWITPRSRHG